MLSFLARSALCIGAVAAAASGIGPERLIGAVGREAREAAGGATRACLASSGCRSAGAEALAAASATASGEAAPRSTAAAGPGAAPRAAARPVGKAEPGGG